MVSEKHKSIIDAVFPSLYSACLAVNMESGDLGAEGDEGPKSRVLGDHVPLLADEGVGDDLAVGEEREHP